MTNADRLNAFNRRLGDHAERILDAIDSMSTPATPVDIARQCRALIVAKRMIDMLMGVIKPRKPAATTGPEETGPEPESEMVPASALSPAPVAAPPLNRQQRRHAEAMERKRGLATSPSPAGSCASTETASEGARSQWSPGTSTT